LISRGSFRLQAAEPMMIQARTGEPFFTDLAMSMARSS